MKKGSGLVLYQVTLAALWRRKGSVLLLAGVAALSVFACIALHNLTSRQETALAQTIEATDIRCVVTDVKGVSSSNLNMMSAFVDMLMGQRHDRGCYLDEYVKNVRAMATVFLDWPDGYSLRRVLSFDSDRALDELEGAVITMEDGWTEDALRTDARVCLIPEGLNTREDEDGRRWVMAAAGERSMELQVIGVISGGPEHVIYCPFYVQWSDDATEIFFVDTCSFDIRDNYRLEESKAAIYEEWFVRPGPAVSAQELVYGVLVQDETYQKVLDEINSNLLMLRLLLPVLMVLVGCIGSFSSYLAARGRLREFAVMRCLGMKQRSIFALVFLEQAVLALAGGLIGTGFGCLLEGGLAMGALTKAGVMLGIFMIGSAIAALRMTSVNTMELMKVEE